jgi:hypothetical protein
MNGVRWSLTRSDLQRSGSSRQDDPARCTRLQEVKMQALPPFDVHHKAVDLQVCLEAKTTWKVQYGLSHDLSLSRAPLPVRRCRG